MATDAKLKDIKMIDQIMTDLETMGTEPFSPIIAIGAVRFDMDVNESTFDVFYQSITLESCIELGLKPSASTILWWAKQSKEAQAVLDDSDAVSLPMALDSFTDWLNSRPDTMWGNPARFGYGLLSAAYRACNKVVPWDHWREACYRTIKNLPKAKEIQIKRTGTYHNALDDAMNQMRHLQQIYQHLNL